MAHRSTPREAHRDDRIDMGIEEVRTILFKIWPYLLVGIGLGAVIHGWVPEQWIADHATSGLWGVIVAVGLGVPLYSNAAGILPLVETLHDKGLPMGTVLAFMMSVVALSMPEMVLLRRVLKKPLIVTYVAVVATGILVIGYLFNLVLLKGRIMDIKILGTGCAKCQKLEQLTREAVASLGLDATIAKVTDPGEIASWGVMTTPALVVDDRVVASGRVPSEADLTALLAETS